MLEDAQGLRRADAVLVDRPSREAGELGGRQRLVEGVSSDSSRARE
jgi:hypothetical protein